MILPAVRNRCTIRVRRLVLIWITHFNIRTRLLYICLMWASSFGNPIIAIPNPSGKRAVRVGISWSFEIRTMLPLLPGWRGGPVRLYYKASLPLTITSAPIRYTRQVFIGCESWFPRLFDSSHVSNRKTALFGMFRVTSTMAYIERNTNVGMTNHKPTRHLASRLLWFDKNMHYLEKRANVKWWAAKNKKTKKQKVNSHINLSSKTISSSL